MGNIVVCQYCGKQYSNKGIGTHIWRVHGEGKTFNPNIGYIKGTRVAWNKGLTKEINPGIASMANKLSRQKSPLELELDDDGKLQRKWINKRVNAKAEGIEFELTFEEFMQLVSDAMLKSSQLGFTGEGYVLARYNDLGPYSYNNCRFITQKENAAERKISDKSRQASSINISKYNNRGVG